MPPDHDRPQPRGNSRIEPPFVQPRVTDGPAAEVGEDEAPRVISSHIAGAEPPRPSAAFRGKESRPLRRRQAVEYPFADIVNTPRPVRELCVNPPQPSHMPQRAENVGESTRG